LLDDTLYGKKVVSHGGNILGFTGYYGRIQEEDVCVVILNNIFNHQIETIGQSMLAILYDKPYAYFNEIKLNPEAAERYVGDYEVNTDYKVKVSREADRLFIQRNDQPKVEVFEYQKNVFFRKDDDVRISFKEENGQMVKITIIEGLSTKRGDRIKL
jgi:hypothetical protein